MRTQHAVSTAGLRKVYGDRTVLDGIDVDVPTGSVFALLGPNGAGKTTMVHILTTLIPADGGRATVAGYDVASDPDAVRAGIGVTGQFSAVDDLLTGAENLRLMADLHHLGVAGRRRVADLLARFDIADVADQLVSTYSGGERRRLDLAMTLVGDPRVIFLDEPTAGLDPEERNRFLNLLAAIGDNVVVILSTHIVDDVADLCSEMAIIAGGRVLQTGRPRAAMDKLVGKTWTRTIDKVQLDDYQREHLVISTRLAGGRTVIHVFAEDDPGDGFAAVDPDLEDVYFTTLARAA
jgi:ABC-2 type transport system ATP-binding protein